MKDTDFYVPGEKLDRLALAFYEQTAGEMKGIRDNSLGIRLFHGRTRLSFMKPEGRGLVSTIEDYSDLRLC